MIKNVIIEIKILKTIKAVSADGDISAFLRERITDIDYDLDARENKADRLTLTFIDTINHDITRLLKEGTKINVKFGYHEESLVIANMTIYSVDTNFNEDGTTTISATGLAIGIGVLNFNIIKKTWVQANASEKSITLTKIVEEIAKKHGLQVAISDKALTDKIKFDAIQQFETDYSFLKKLAANHGFTCDIDEKKIYFIHRKTKMEKIKEDKSMVKLGYKCNIGLPLLNFNARIDIKETDIVTGATTINPKGEIITEKKQPKVPSGEKNASSENVFMYKQGKDGSSKITEKQIDKPQKKETTPAESRMGSMKQFYEAAKEKVTKFIGIDEFDEKELDKEMAKTLKGMDLFTNELMGDPGGTAEHVDTKTNSLQHQNPNDITASGTVIGTNQLIKGNLIKIYGVGRWSGVWKLDRVSHIVNTSGYKTNFDCSSDSFLSGTNLNKFNQKRVNQKEKSEEKPKEKPKEQKEKICEYNTTDPKTGAKLNITEKENIGKPLKKKK